ALPELEAASEEQERRTFPEAIQVAPDLFEYQGRVLTRPQMSLVTRRERLLASPDRQWLRDFPARFPILFVTDQRLVVLDDRAQQTMRRATGVRHRTAVEQSARDLARQMQQNLSAYAQESQRMDRDFPQRVVRAMASEDEVP